MTFDEWAVDNWMYVDDKESARVIWDAACRCGAPVSHNDYIETMAVDGKVTMVPAKPDNL